MDSFYCCISDRAHFKYFIFCLMSSICVFLTNKAKQRKLQSCSWVWLMVNCQYLQVGLKFDFKLSFSVGKNSWLQWYSSKFGNLCTWSHLVTCLIRSDVVRAAISSIFSTSHMLVKVNQRKLICYDDKSLKLIYLPTRAVFPHKAQITWNRESWASGRLPHMLVFHQLKARGLSSMCTNHQNRAASQLAQLKPV